MLTDAVSGGNGTAPFNFSGSAAASGMPGATFLWNFGDGSSTATGGSANHSFTVPGNYTVALFARDGYGDVEERTHAVVVQGRAVLFPAVTGGPDTAHGLAPLSVKFSVNASGGAGPVAAVAANGAARGVYLVSFC